jgi:hypothetical protein
VLNYIRTDAQHLLAEYSMENQNEIDAKFQSVRSRFETGSAGTKPRLRSSWCSVGLDARATKTGFQRAYKFIYPMGNKLLHGTIGGMSMHAQRSDDSARIAVPPSLRYCRSALVGGHMCAVRMVETVSKTMGQEPSPALDVLANDYSYAWVDETDTRPEVE